MAERRRWLADRTTGDLLILLVAGTVCGAVLLAGFGLFAVTVLSPGRDTTQGFHAISDVINTLIGLLAGFLAGRTDAHLNMTLNADAARTWEVQRQTEGRGVDAGPDV